MAPLLHGNTVFQQLWAWKTPFVLPFAAPFAKVTRNSLKAMLHQQSDSKERVKGKHEGADSCYTTSGYVASVH